MTNENYHYVESGLPDVWLRNGFTYHDTPHGRGVSIMDVDGLHEAIGTRLATGSHPLSGAEMRFLRHELDLSQAVLANLLGVDAQSVARWEKGQTAVQKTAERMVRMIYLESIDKNSTMTDLLTELSKVDNIVDQGELYLDFTGDEWQAAA